MDTGRVPVSPRVHDLSLPSTLATRRQHHTPQDIKTAATKGRPRVSTPNDSDVEQGLEAGHLSLGPVEQPEAETKSRLGVPPRSQDFIDLLEAAVPAGEALQNLKVVYWQMIDEKNDFFTSNFIQLRETRQIKTDLERKLKSTEEEKTLLVAALEQSQARQKDDRSTPKYETPEQEGRDTPTSIAASRVSAVSVSSPTVPARMSHPSSNAADKEPYIVPPAPRSLYSVGTDGISTLRFPKPGDLSLRAEELRIKALLIPAMLLLRQLKHLQRKDLEEASYHAREAFHEARRLHGTTNGALQSRCAFYVGLAGTLLLGKTPRDALSFAERGRKREECLEFFEMARDPCAAGLGHEQRQLVEGEWAKGWVSYLKMQNSSHLGQLSPKVMREAKEKQPSRSQSWFHSWSSNYARDWPHDKRQANRKHEVSQKNDWPSRPLRGSWDSGERVPTFDSISSGASLYTSSIPRPSLTEDASQIPGKKISQRQSVNQSSAAARPESRGEAAIRWVDNDLSERPTKISPVCQETLKIVTDESERPPSSPQRQRKYFITNPDPQSQDSSTTGPSIPDTQDQPSILPSFTRGSMSSPSPKAHRRSSSLHSSPFKLADAISSPQGSVEDGSGMASHSPRRKNSDHRRKSSILERVTGRDREKSDIGMMEEGQSPRRENVADLGSAEASGVGGGNGRSGMKQRKSQAPEEMV